MYAEPSRFWFRLNLPRLDRASALLYPRAMPAQVIVVRRPRRNRFAIPRALPDWLHSIGTVLFGSSPDDPDVVGLDAPGLNSIDAALFPRLVLDASGAHRCVGCEICVHVCPSHSLEIDITGKGQNIRVTRFDLDRGSCIGCGLCSLDCPEDAFEMTAGALVELAPLVGRSDRTSLPENLLSASSGSRRG